MRDVQAVNRREQRGQLPRRVGDAHGLVGQNHLRRGPHAPRLVCPAAPARAATRLAQPVELALLRGDAPQPHGVHGEAAATDYAARSGPRVRPRVRGIAAAHPGREGLGQERLGRPHKRAARGAPAPRPGRIRSE